MYLQEILEVAIGLVFAWLILSIATMQIQEWWNTIFEVRAKTLEERIATLLASPYLKEDFYNHPIIQSLYTRAVFLSNKERKPAYIPAQQFSKVLFDILRTAGTEESLTQKYIHTFKREFERQASGLKDQRQAAAEMFDSVLDLAAETLKTRTASETAQKALQQARLKANELTEMYPVLQELAEQAVSGIETYLAEISNLTPSASTATDSLKKGVAALSVLSPGLKHTLNTLIFGLEEKIERGEEGIFDARKNIEEWFNASMERLGGLFKRRAEVWAFFFGLLFAMLINVDAIQISTLLWREPTIRQALVANAEKFVAANPEGTDTPEGASPSQAVAEFKKQFAALTVPIGWNLEKVDDTTQACVFEPADPATQTFGIKIRSKFILRILQLQPGCYRPVETEPTTSGWGWLGLKIVGFFISALATVQGAPFWFDILKKLVNVRGSGLNPAEDQRK
ncbi:MAG: hypothetical protein ACUVRJ_02215 [Candidatus Villigracilaceae bacterium]